MDEPRPDFKFRSGKHKGMTYKWVCEKDPQYVRWIKENQPNMLREVITKITNIKEDRRVFGKLPFNTNFDNEGPAPNSIPYLEKMIEESKKDEFNS